MGTKQKRRFFLSLLSLIFVFNWANAQQITGVVIDKQRQPIEFANVALYSLPDSTLITGVITNAKGEFSIIPNGKSAKDMFLKISFIGYESQIVLAQEEQTIVLQTESTQLGEVVATSNLPKIQIKNDALVTTVQNSVLSKAGTGNDVLKRLPSLTGDKGAFSVFGKGDAKIYINNREMRDISELENLSSADIRNVEIVNNPGARYDASVKAVIRINTVRKVGDGFGFNIRSSYFQSQNIVLREQLDMNYRKNGLDIFGTFKYNRDEFIQDSKIEQKTNTDTLWTQNSTLYVKGLSNFFTGIAGINYEISSKNYIGMKYTISVFPKAKILSEMNSEVFANNAYYDKWNSKEDVRSDYKPDHRLNIYYDGELGDLNIDFNTDFYGNKLFKHSSVFEESREYNNKIVNSENRVENRLFASKLVLSYPVLDGQFSLGSEYTNTNREDEYVNKEGIIPKANTTIKEQNSAFFAEYSRTTSIGQIGAGLRYENVNTDYFSNGKKEEEQSRPYHQWFPNISFGTQIKKMQIQLSYTAKTKRPTYRQLSSNMSYYNRLTMQTGNPFLKPSIIHDITLVASWKIAQLMVSYKNERNAIIYWMEQLKDKSSISLMSFRNLEKLPNLSAFLTLSPTFGIWSPQLSGGFQKQWLIINSNGQDIALNKPMFFASLKNSFKLPKDFLFTLDADYQGKGHYQNIYISEHRFVVNIGLIKSFFDNCLSLELKGHDLFKRAIDGSFNYNPKIELYQFNRFDSRELELTIRYKFNLVKSKYKGKGAGENEINRL